MSLRDAGIWGGALLVSLLLHLALFWSGALSSGGQREESKKPVGSTRLNFRVAAKPPAPVPESIPKPEPKPVEPPKPKPQPEPVIPKPEQPAPIIEPVPEAEPEPEIAETASERESAEQETAAAEQAPDGGDPQQQAQAQQNYLGALLAHIEEHKFYPRAARRRGLQGVIQISFILHEDGSISDLQLQKGHETLRKAAEESMRAALPLPIPPGEIICPLKVSFGMNFKLH